MTCFTKPAVRHKPADANVLNSKTGSTPLLYGAMIGDIVGSKYEFDNIRHKDFPMFSKGCSFTDDTVMTVAVANALLNTEDLSALPAAMVAEM